MLRSRGYVKRTRGGKVVKVVKEHYLRDDIPCGSAFCSGFSPGCAVYASLERKGSADASSSLLDERMHTSPHLVVDTNIALHQIDVLERGILKSVVLTQTVLDEVKHHNESVYARLRALAETKDAEYFVFANEHHRDTFVEKQPNESPNDRNDRAIRSVCAWYSRHLEGRASIILLTNDGDCRKKAQEDGLTSYSLLEYIATLPPELRAQLEDVASSDVMMESLNDAMELFPKHLALSLLQSGVKSGKFLQGTFRTNRYNYVEGSVIIEGLGDVLLKGRVATNRAVDGDVVAIQLLDESEWQSPSTVIAEAQDVDMKENEEEKNMDNEERAVEGLKRPSAVVVGIIRRNWRPYCGSILRPTVEDSSGRARICTFVPASRVIPRIKIRTRQYERLVGKRIVVSMDEWDRHSKYPFGHYVRVLGDANDRDTERELLLVEHDVRFQPFSERVLACLPKLPWTFSSDDIISRRDLRHINVFSVDPPGCTDIDDALSAVALPNGHVEIGVHIADVTHFVRPNTALDEEAARRGTTVYLVDQRIDMLPELLGTNLCSLRENEDRFAFSVIWEMDMNANVHDVQFCKTVIRSRAALTYAEAQGRLDNPLEHANDLIARDFRVLATISQLLKLRRMAAGALSLASPEVKFSLDSETHDPLDCQTYEVRVANSVVEEFMLLANEYVARRTHETFREYALLRRHPEPPLERFEKLRSILQRLNFDLDPSTSKSLAASLDTCVLPEFPYFNKLVRILTTRCMMQAEYFCTGLFSFQQFRHYGLAMDYYTHFTSPIRRYADVIVHRFLAASIGCESIDPALLNKENVNKDASNINRRHLMAMLASRTSISLYTVMFFRNRREICEAVVIGVKKNGIVVLVPKYGFEAAIYLDSKHGFVDDPFVFDEENVSISRVSGTERYDVFGRVAVSVSVDESQTSTLSLNIKLCPDVDVNSVGKEDSSSLQKLVDALQARSVGHVSDR